LTGYCTAGRADNNPGPRSGSRMRCTQVLSGQGPGRWPEMVLPAKSWFFSVFWPPT